MKQIAASLLLAMLFALVALPAAAQPAPLPLYSPPKDSNVEVPDVLFTWAERPDASHFHLTVSAIDGSRTVTLNIPNAGCDGTCTNAFDIELADWQWKENSTYRWHVPSAESL